jgi:endonuclease YncB( thermonuclease family)
MSIIKAGELSSFRGREDVNRSTICNIANITQQNMHVELSMTRFRLLPMFLLVSILLSHSVSYAKTPIRVIHGAVVNVSDGDTINVDSNGTKLKIRFYGIDTPETAKMNKRTGQVNKSGQPYGDEAWHALESKIANQQVRVEVMDRDRYGRLVSIVWLGNRNINREMVTDGWAWAYRQYLDSPHASEYINAEEQARASKLGLWKQSNPQPPWEFRKALRLQGE